MSTSQENRCVKELANSIQYRSFKPWNIISIKFLLEFPGPASYLFHIVTDLINALPGSSSVNTLHYATIKILFSMGSAPRPLLCNGSVNKPQQQRDCFLCGPCRGYITIFPRITKAVCDRILSSEFSVGDSHGNFVDLWSFKVWSVDFIWSDLKR
jgi:hypothetical protein